MLTVLCLFWSTWGKKLPRLISLGSSSQIGKNDLLCVIVTNLVRFYWVLFVSQTSSMPFNLSLHAIAWHYIVQVNM